MNAVQVEQKNYEMPPREGISIHSPGAELSRDIRVRGCVSFSEFLDLKHRGRR